MNDTPDAEIVAALDTISADAHLMYVVILLMGTKSLAAHFVGWTAERLVSALNELERAGVITITAKGFPQ